LNCWINFKQDWKTGRLEDWKTGSMEVWKCGILGCSLYIYQFPAVH
jgi:hypothetical protein